MKASAIVQEAIFEQKTKGVVETTRELEGMGKAAKGAADGQAILAKQTEVAEKSVTRVASKLETYTRQFDPLTKALRDAERGESLLALAMKNGIPVTEQHSRAVEAARERYNKLNAQLNDNTKATGLNRAGWINLSRQLQDVGVSLYGGQSPMTVLAQQGGQIADVFSSSKGGAAAALKDFGSAVTGFVLNPITLLVGSIAALTAAMVQFEGQQTRLQRAANGAGAFSGMSPEQLRQAGLAGAAAGGLAPSQGITSAATLASTGRIGGELIPGLVASSQRYADAFGMDQAEALKELAKAFSDPVAGAEQLDEKLGFLDAQTKEYIRTLREQGDTLGAQRALFGAFEASLAKTADTTWSLTRAWRLLRSGFESPIQTITSAIDSALVAPKSGAEAARDRARAQRAGEERDAQIRSQEITDRVTKFIPEISTKRSLQDAAAFFRDAEKHTGAMSRLGVSIEDFYKAQEQASVRVENYKTATEKARAEGDLRIAQMNTLSETTKAGLEAQKVYNDTLGQEGDRDLAATRAANIRAEAMARVNAALREYNAAAKDELALAGLSPYQRGRVQIDQDAKKFAERYGVIPSGVKDRYAAQEKQSNFDLFGSPMADIEGQSRALDVRRSTLGKSTYDTAFDTAYMEKYNQVLKERGEITPEAIEQMNRYAEAHANLAVKTEEVDRAQTDLRDALDITRSTIHDIGMSLVDAFRRGESAARALEDVLNRLVSKLLDKTLDMAINSLLGPSGGTSTGGLGKLFGFSEGGIMTSAGPLPLRTYSSGGIANTPQLALFGENRTPEAYVPVPSGKIPVEMRGGGQGGLNVKVVNNVAGAMPEVQRMSDGELLVVFNKLVDEKLQSQVPTVLANYQRRAQ